MYGRMSEAGNRPPAQSPRVTAGLKCARNVADSVRHGHDGQAECEGDTGESDPELRKSGGENGTAAAAEHEPKRTEELGAQTLRDAVHHK